MAAGRARSPMEAKRLMARYQGLSVAQIISATERPEPARLKLLKRQIIKLITRIEGSEK